MHVIGTAGHVDHGKSSLINALTGIHPDRLKEEKSREMSIELGFAWMELSNKQAIGIIDVPGHRDFIENMLAGIGGIDAVLLVIAADEGFMPQTHEHLAIIDLLEINTGIIVLNKIDLAEDKDWIDLVEIDIRDQVKKTVLENAPIIKVSAKSGEGLDELKSAIESMLETHSPRKDLRRPRLSIDRVFSLSGFGTIVTGTLLDGSLSIGDEIYIHPTGKIGRIRGLQTHKQKEATAFPGSRTAINITGITRNELNRGYFLSKPGDYTSTNIIDLHVKLLPDATSPLKHNMQLKFFIGAAEILAQCRVLGKNSIQPGEEGFIQLRLTEKTLAVRGDHYIIRKPSPPETLGGGIVLNPHPGKLHRRFDENTIKILEELYRGDPEDLILQSAIKLVISNANDLIKHANLEIKTGLDLIERLQKENKLILIKSNKLNKEARLMPLCIWEKESKQLLGFLDAFFKANPLKQSIPKEFLKTKYNNPNLFDTLIEQLDLERVITLKGSNIILNSHKIVLDQDQEDAIESFMTTMEKSLFAPPGCKEAIEILGEDLLQYLIDQGAVIKVSEDILFSQKAYNQLMEFTKNTLNIAGSITIGELRDKFQTSRKYALAFLEHLDTIGITILKEEKHILKQV